MAKSKRPAKVPAPQTPQAPALGEVVTFHDPRDSKSYPAVVCHVDPFGTLDLHVLRPTDYNVPFEPGEFGHWGPTP